MLLLALSALASPPAWLLDPSRPPPRDAIVDADGAVAALVRADGDTLVQRGLRVRRRADGSFRGGLGFVSVTADRTVLAGLHRAGFEIRPDVRIDLGPYPDDVTGPAIGAPQMRAHAEGPTGAGVTVANIDSHIEVTHPHFFRADAGSFDWVDVDGDGVLTPGVDGLDLDRDGRVAPDETLEELEGLTYRWDSEAERYVFDEEPGVLDPRRDWLYLDLDGNGVRDAGRPGWNDEDPGMAEPTFVPDDVDGDGVLEPGERVFQLGSSVIRSIYWDGQLFDRGFDLSAYDRRVYEVDGAGFAVDADRYHGTAVSGIIAGGQLPAQRQFTGIAPDADLVFISRYSVEQLSDLLDYIDIAEELEADVLLHEYAPWLGYSLDGSDLVEQAVDRLAEQGMAQVCAAGNLADAGKHGVLADPGDGQGAIDVEVIDGVYSLWLEWHYPGPVERVSCTVAVDEAGCPSCDPEDRFSFTLALGDVQLEDGATAAYFTRDLSAAGNARGTVALWRPAGGALPEGTWSLACNTSEPLDVYLIDGSGWGRGSTFEPEVPAKTMGLPSTAEHCVAVAAYALQFPYDGDQPGDLHSWSSRGPALGGQKTIDVAAPDDAFAPSASYTPDGAGSYTLFSGTSSAAPHVTGLVALMKQVEPDLTGPEVRQRLRDTARVDGSVEVGDGWGAGRVDGYAALFGGTPPAVPEPAELEVEWFYASGRAQARITGASEIRWDFDYDGVVDAIGPVGDVMPGEFVRVDAYTDGYRVGGLVLDAIPSDYTREPRRGCSTAAGVAGSSGWALSAALLGLSRRRGRRAGPGCRPPARAPRG
ncbi:MAG: S8 family serine peptidase [Myxococcota bacterium]